MDNLAEKVDNNNYWEHENCPLYKVAGYPGSENIARLYGSLIPKQPVSRAKD